MFRAILLIFFCYDAATQRGSWPPHSWGFLDHTQRRSTVGRTPPDEWSGRRRDLYLITHDTHNRQTSMPPVGFEPTISAGERPQTYALDRPATGTGVSSVIIAHSQEFLICNYSFWFYTHLSLPDAVMAQPWQRPATTNVCKPRSCNYSLEAPDDER